MLFHTDEDAWNKALVQDLWVMDKLILAKKLGHACGPKGVDVPRPGKYVVRPIVNAMGMGLGAHTKYIKDSTDRLPDGFFWCEAFEGVHSSIDYYRGQEILYVEGIKREGFLDRFHIWEKQHFKTLPLPAILDQLQGQYDFINVERVGDKIIEIHLRPNPDFIGHKSDYVRPIYRGETYKLNRYEQFIERPDADRLGFIIDGGRQ